ncbi:BnaA01g24620D [Brassica napus]|uniref:BnaA01g24620D protein n=1 Tax=Brassica napus TaxID=3708 RepID=A0A078H6P6_BRANA|nr:BnaA01g24620D [Brassica napus]
MELMSDKRCLLPQTIWQLEQYDNETEVAESISVYFPCVFDVCIDVQLINLRSWQEQEGRPLRNLFLSLISVWTRTYFSVLFVIL